MVQESCSLRVMGYVYCPRLIWWHMYHTRMDRDQWGETIYQMRRGKETRLNNAVIRFDRFPISSKSLVWA